jgi:hypothetical protein
MEFDDVLREMDMESGVFIVQMVVGMVIGLGIQAVICYFAKKYLDAIPETFHVFPSWQVWLLMIPLFGIVWNYFVFPRIARSYQNLFEYYGVHDTGDSGYGLGVAYCITMTPPISCCASMIGWVLIIIFLVKLAELRKQAEWVVHQAWEAHQQSQSQEPEAE